MAAWKIKLLYDGACPICRREVQWLRQHDRKGRLALEDLSRPNFDPSFYGLTRDEASAALHAVLANGEIVRGIDAVAEAYRAVGLGWVATMIRLPVAHTFFKGLYRIFARNRLWLGQLLTGACRTHACQRPR